MKVSVVGAAGTVGSCTAYTLAMQGPVDEILMLDAKQNVLVSHVMDISAAVVGRRRVLVRAGSYPDLSGSDIVVISAGVHLTGAPVKERLAPNVPIICEIAGNIERYCPEAVVITATNPVDLLNYAIHLSAGLERHKLIGYNLNDTLRFRMAVARTLGIESNRVEAFAAGDHPGSPVQLFSSITIDGQPFSLDQETRKRLQEELRDYLRAFESLKAGRTAGWTSASGIAVIVRAVLENEQKVLSCSAILDGEYGYRSLSMGVPVIIGKDGIHQILQWEIFPDEKQELDKVAGVLQANCDYVRSTISQRQ